MFVGPKKFKVDRQKTKLVKIQLGITRQNWEEKEIVREQTEKADEEEAEMVEARTQMLFSMSVVADGNTQSTQASSDDLDEPESIWGLPGISGGYPPRAFSFYTGMPLKMAEQEEYVKLLELEDQHPIDNIQEEDGVSEKSENEEQMHDPKMQLVGKKHKPKKGKKHAPDDFDAFNYEGAMQDTIKGKKKKDKKRKRKH